MWDVGPKRYCGMAAGQYSGELMKQIVGEKTAISWGMGPWIRSGAMEARVCVVRRQIHIGVGGV